MMEEQTTKTVTAGEGAPVVVADAPAGVPEQPPVAEPTKTDAEPKPVVHAVVGAIGQAPIHPVVAQVAAAGGVPPEKKAVLVSDPNQVAASEFMEMLKGMSVPGLKRPFDKKFNKKKYTASVAERLAIITTLEELTPFKDELFESTGRLKIPASNQTLKSWVAVARKAVVRKAVAKHTDDRSGLVYPNECFVEEYCALMHDLDMALAERGISVPLLKTASRYQKLTPATYRLAVDHSDAPAIAQPQDAKPAVRRIKYAKTNRRPHQPTPPMKKSWRERFDQAKSIEEVEAIAKEASDAVRTGEVSFRFANTLIWYADGARQRFTLVEDGVDRQSAKCAQVEVTQESTQPVTVSLPAGPVEVNMDLPEQKA